MSLAGRTYGCYDEAGTAKASQTVTGAQTNVQTSSNSAYAVPTAITQGKLVGNNDGLAQRDRLV